MAMREKHAALVRLFWKRLGMLALALLILAAGMAVANVYGKERESHVLRTQAERELAELRLQENRLYTDIAQLKTNRGKEEALRTQYEVGREGENLIIIVEPKAPEPIEASSTARTWVRKFLPFW